MAQRFKGEVALRRVTDPVTDPVLKLLLVVAERSLAPSDIQSRLQLRHRPTFRENYLHAAIDEGFIERTIPD